MRSSTYIDVVIRLQLGYQNAFRCNLCYADVVTHERFFLLTYFSPSLHEEHRPSTTALHRVFMSGPLFLRPPRGPAARCSVGFLCSASLVGSRSGLAWWCWRGAFGECGQSISIFFFGYHLPQDLARFFPTGRYCWLCPSTSGVESSVGTRWWRSGAFSLSPERFFTKGKM